MCVNCAAWTDVDGAESKREAAHAVNADGAGNLARAAAGSSVPLLHISTDYVFDGDPRRWTLTGSPRPTSSPIRPGRVRCTAPPSSKASARCSSAPAQHTVVRTSWLYGVDGRNFVDTMLRLAAEREAVQVVDDQIGSSHLVRAPRARPAGAARARGARARAPRRRRCGLLERLRAGDLPPGRGRVPRCEAATTAEQMARPAPRPAWSALESERGEVLPMPPWQDGLAGYLAARNWDDSRMKLLVCGGAGFIGSTFVRQRLLEHGDEVTVLDKLTYAGREENFHDIASEPGFRFVRGAIEDADAVAAAIDAARPRRSSTSPPRRTSIARSPSPTRSCSTHALGTYVLLEAARERELRYVQVSTDEVYGSIEDGTFTEDSPLRPSSPYSATKTGADLLVQSYFHTYGLPASICRGSNNYGPYQYPEKLIPLMVLNALHGDALPVYGDGMQVRNWIHATDFARAIGHVLEHGDARRGLQRGRPRRAGQHRRRQAHHRAHRRRRSHRSSTSPTAPATTAATRSPRRRCARWAGSRGCASRRAWRETVAWYRENAWWWEPIRSGDYRAYYERQYGRALS